MNNIDKSIIDMSNIKQIMNDIVINYCYEHDVDEKNIPPQIWLDIISELHEIIFKNNKKLLKHDDLINNAYDMDKVLYVYEIYKRLCNSHCMVVNLKGFEDLTGIDHQTFYNWSARSSSLGVDIREKIMRDNEQSLEAMLHDPRVNPMKVLPSLNKHHQWSQPGVTREVVHKHQLGVSDLPKLGLEIVKDAQLDTD